MHYLSRIGDVLYLRKPYVGIQLGTLSRSRVGIKNPAIGQIIAHLNQSAGRIASVEAQGLFGRSRGALIFYVTESAVQIGDRDSLPTVGIFNARQKAVCIVLQRQLRNGATCSVGAELYRRWKAVAVQRKLQGITVFIGDLTQIPTLTPIGTRRIICEGLNGAVGIGYRDRRRIDG